LIWAAELLATMRQDTTLVIIGEGPQSGELMRFRDAVSIPNHVRFAGSRDDVADLLPHADLFWLGSQYEGQSNALIEAMQAALPVVVTDIPGNRDLVTPDQTGRLVPIGDRAEFARETHDLLEHPLQRKQMGEQARQRIEREFGIDVMTERHAELYRDPPVGRKF
jgi:glycosyltransferase involved in cell wall biosynthesis